jgi:hypothetical protein
MEVCRFAAPEWKEVEPGHFCACHLYDNAEEKRRAEEEALKVQRAESGKQE